MTKKELRKHFDYLPNGTFKRKTAGQNRPKGQIVTGSLNSDGYRIICFLGARTTFSRAVFLWHFGKIKGEIDHINKNRSDNRIENLRDLSPAQNCQNRIRNPESNVYWIAADKLWKVCVCGFKIKKTQYFKNFKAAQIGARKLRKELHGRFAQH